MQEKERRNFMIPICFVPVSITLEGALTCWEQFDSFQFFSIQIQKFDSFQFFSIQKFSIFVGMFITSLI